MTELKKSLMIAMTLGLTAFAAQAQETTAPATTEAPAATAPAAEAPTTPAAPAPAEDGPGSIYVAQTVDAWSIQCMRAEAGNDPCEMRQRLNDAEGNGIADISMVALPEGGEAVAGVTIITPLETVLTQHVTLQVDTAEPSHRPFHFCAPVGCVSRFGLTAAELDAYKKGNKIEMTIFPVRNPETPVKLEISLKGFTAAFDAVKKAGAASQ